MGHGLCVMRCVLCVVGWALGYAPSMKRIVPVLIAVAAAAATAIAAVKLFEEDPRPTGPEGTWELDEDRTPS